MQWTPIICLVAIAEYLFFAVRVGTKRGPLGVAVPATTGNEEWECLFRVQQNTMEQMVAFLPAAFAFAWFISDPAAAALGGVWVLGRAIYFVGYTGGDPGKRAPGAIMTMGSTTILLIGSLYGAVRAML